MENFGQRQPSVWSKKRNKGLKFLVMTTIYTLWTIHKTTGHYNYKKKRTFCVDSKLQKCNNDLFDRFYSMTRVCNLFKKNKWLFDGHWLIWIWTLCYNKCEIWFLPFKWSIMCLAWFILFLDISTMVTGGLKHKMWGNF